VQHQTPGPITLNETGLTVKASAEDEAIMARFLDDYLALLDARVSSIKEHLDNGEDMTVNVVLLSLESSSSMVGARELATIVSLLRGAVERHERRHVPTLVQAMSNEAERFRASVVAH
jgi:hypothetical protein